MSIKSYFIKKTSFLISSFFLILSSVLILFVYLKYRISPEEFFFGYYFKYFIATIGFFIFSIIFIFLKKDYQINLFVSFVSLLFVIYTVEIFLFKTNFLDKPRFKKEKIELIKKKEVKYDFRSELQVYKDLKKKENLIVKSIVPKTFLFEKNQKIIPLSGISNSKTIMCNENGYYASYISDEYGFRNSKDAWQNKENEILIVGDSFAHGACVNDSNTITGNLKRLFKTKKIINIGYGGNGPLLEYASIREYLPLIKPKKLLWIYYEQNDLIDLSNELQNKILNNYLIDKEFKQNLIYKQTELNSKLYNKLNDQFKSRLSYMSVLKLKNLRRLTIDRISSIEKKKNEVKEVPIKEFSNILKKVKLLLKEKNIEFYFVYLPEYKRSLENTFSNKDLNNYNLVIKTVKKLNINLIDINEKLFLDNLKDPLSLYPFRSYGHFNELGYRIISEKIFENLAEKT